ncbi:MAG: hypothetical protein KDA94_16850 [Acidimicrobiales bacterium]|nr:hypothetical protein [Acidimicrobiales bacterium]
MAAEPPKSNESWPGDFLLHPVCLAAIVVLVVNDWAIKARWPGAVAGKLSDVAGMVFFPLLLVALAELALLMIGRKRMASPTWFVISAAAVGAVFAATKTIEPVRTADEWILGQLRWLPLAAIRAAQQQPIGDPTYPDVVPDATDVLCVPFVLVAIWIGNQYRRPPRAHSATASE